MPVPWIPLAVGLAASLVLAGVVVYVIYEDQKEKEAQRVRQHHGSRRPPPSRSSNSTPSETSNQSTTVCQRKKGSGELISRAFHPKTSCPAHPKCVICLKQRPNVVLLPCKGRSLCSKCAPRFQSPIMRFCPDCEKRIDEFVVV